ncbi:MAG: DNA cytosine methyltransferase [Candidatus Saccharimonadales bacterium]
MKQPQIQTSLLPSIHDDAPYDFTFIDLFAGIGGTRLGFEAVGGRCVFTSEWDIHAQKTYQANFGETPHGDITKIASKDIPDFDVLLAGFPCQPFSSIGKRAGFLHKTQGTLFYDVARIIKDKRPKAFLLENVSGLLTHDKGKTLATILEVLQELEYDVHYQLINAADFGVPQMRKRVYIVGFDKNSLGLNTVNFTFPIGRPSEHVNIGEFLEKGVSGYSISKRLQNNYLFKLHDGRPLLIDGTSKGPAKTLVASYHKIQRLTGTFVKDGETGLRLYTANECKALMGFPKSFKVPVSRTQMYRQFGNSVVVPVIKAIAESMHSYIVKETRR